MKKNLILFCISIVFISCTNRCIEDISFKNFYFSKLNQIVEYDNYTLTDTTITTESWINFYYNTAYLYFLTGHQFRYVATEPPGYTSELDLKADIKDLKKWYNENKCGMTKEKADSIVNANPAFLNFKP